MMENNHVELWNRCLQVIRDNVPEPAFNTWFKPIIPLKYENKTLTVEVPSQFLSIVPRLLPNRQLRHSIRA